MAEPVVLYPTVETNNTENLSPYLEDLVRQQGIPSEAASVFNRLPNLQLQKEAVARFQACQATAAWRIYADLQRPPSPSRWAKLKKPTRFLGIVVAGWLVWVCFPSKGVTPSTNSEPVNQSAVSTERISQPPTTPAASASSHEIKITSKSKVQTRPKALQIYYDELRFVPVPSRLEIHMLAGKVAQLAWNNLGKGYTYTVYSADDAAMHNMHKVQDRIVDNSYIFQRQTTNRTTCWVAVTATKPEGRQSELSESLRIKL